MVLSDLVFVCIVAIIGLKKLLVVLNAVLVIVILNCRLYSFLGEYRAVNLYCRQSVKSFHNGFVCELQCFAYGLTLIISVAIELVAIAEAQP